MTALVIAGVGGYFSATLAMRDQVTVLTAKQDALKEQIEQAKLELVAQIRQVDASSQQRRNDTREELMNQLQNVHSEMSELRQQVYRKP